MGMEKGAPGNTPCNNSPAGLKTKSERERRRKNNDTHMYRRINSRGENNGHKCYLTEEKTHHEILCICSVLGMKTSHNLGTGGSIHFLRETIDQ